MVFNLFKKKEEKAIQKKPAQTNKSTNEKVATRKGEIGEYKIDIQLSQLPQEYKYLNDLLIENPKSASGYSQVDHVVISPYGIFVIETKNYQGTIYGGKDRKTWLVNGKFKMLSPLVQNYGHIEALKGYIDQRYHDKFISLVSFTKRCTLKIDMDLRDIHSDELVIYDILLTETINRKVAISKLKNSTPLLSDKDSLVIYESFNNANITDIKIREKHNRLLKEKQESQPTKEKSTTTCTVCHKPVSDKVVSYCISNKKFKGKVYCYEHQKTV
ncbi:nuclease-related domain-containing protein [Ornithinibacillus californiensis]|uniref:nuclease-related domain-containing protein n=1 Tax=Ornithinibacillus californiensis TaxID=161536 RepID=UPI00064DF46B|nr:nuclease-related domain-containing protein [Ornithinibacillus californiensis]